MELAFIRLLALSSIFCTSVASGEFTVEGADSLFPLEDPIATLNVSTDVNRGWSLDQDWFPYVNKSRDVEGLRNSKPYFHTDFTDWDKIDENPWGIWALLFQDPPPNPGNDELPFISYNQGHQLGLRSVSISYYVYGIVSYSITISASDVLIKEDILACSGEPCGFRFVEIQVPMASSTEIGVGSFKLEFNITDDQSFVLIDNILVYSELSPASPTTPFTRQPVFPNTTTTLRLESSTSKPNAGLICSEASHSFILGMALLGLGFSVFRR